MGNLDKVFVYADFLQYNNELIGTIFIENIKGRVVLSFEYEKSWLKNAGFSIDPNLELYGGRQYLDFDKKMYGIFSDSAPDRWGRKLMNLKEEEQAKKENRKPRKLSEVDYLIGVYDMARMGGIRFKTDKNGEYVNNDEIYKTPPIEYLRDLEYASAMIESDKEIPSKQWLNKILAPGSSLGGARPKSNVIDTDGSLWIAKFPSRNDEIDVGAWEMVIHDLAKKSNINVPDAMLKVFSKNGSTFLVKRFDRERENRIFFASSMTLLNKTDGANAQDGSSYLEIASFIRANCVDVNSNLEELFKRIVFSMAVSNIDDHFRNHGFLYKNNGWQLSPMFDVNPSIYGNNLSLNVNESESTIDFELALETSRYYGIESKRAKDIINEIKSIVWENFRDIAFKYKIKKSEINRMESAFKICQG